MTRKLLVALCAILLTLTAWLPSAKAATEAEKLAAIQNGLAHLYSVQAVDGSWAMTGGYNAHSAATGAAIFAFLTQKAKWPAAQAANYQTAVDKGVAYLLANATKTANLTTNNAGINICPGGSGSCIGVTWQNDSYEVYSTGLVIPGLDTYGMGLGANAIATTTGPLANMTWLQIAQANTNAWAAGQATGNNSTYRGGWHYSLPGNTSADMSTTQWGIISIAYNEGLGATTPASVRSNLPTWLNFVHTHANGAACYDGSSYCDHSDTGGWLVGQAFLGNAGTAPVASGIGFISTNWTADTTFDPGNSPWSGNFGHPYAMWAVYKGLEATIGLNDTTHITTFKTTDCGISTGHAPGSGVCNWWEDQDQYLVTTQTTTDAGGNKYWPGYQYWGDTLSTSLFVSIIGAAPLPNSITQPPPATVVPTLTEWGLVILGISLAAFGAMKIRKNAHKVS